MKEKRILFVTGKLAEAALRRTVGELAPTVGFEAEFAVLPITVAALLTTDWIGRHLTVPPKIDRILLPGLCRGDLDRLKEQLPATIRVERGPNDLRELPEFFGRNGRPQPTLDHYDIAILAEINHANRMDLSTLRAVAQHYHDSGADLLDLGCTPGEPWDAIEDAARMLRADGFRLSIDSFHPPEIEAAIRGGVELILSVNQTNLDQVERWQALAPEIEVVAIPDSPSDLDSLDRTVSHLLRIGARFRIDPILEPIAFGFAASLGRYLHIRERYPDHEIMMGIGNVTELTDVDSAGINVLLAGFCQEQRIHSVLTTEVINWSRTSVREFDLARRLVAHAVREKVLPKRLEPRLILLRDPKLYPLLGPEGMAELAEQITDRNYRIFVERGEIHVLNGSLYVHGTDPFVLFEAMAKADAKLDPSHAFYLGYEMAKAITALTLGKNYTQDQSLRWGFLTIPEVSHRNPGGTSPS